MRNRHYRRWKKYGHPLKTIRIPYEKRPTACIATDNSETCGRKVAAHGLCNMHRKRVRKASFKAGTAGD